MFTFWVIPGNFTQYDLKDLPFYLYWKYAQTTYSILQYKVSTIAQPT